MIITIKYGSKRFSFDGSTNVTPIPFGNRERRSITAKFRRRRIKSINNIVLKISELDETLFKELRAAWESLDSKYLYTEDGSVYNIVFPNDLTTTYSFDYNGKKYYEATLNMEEVE